MTTLATQHEPSFPPRPALGFDHAENPTDFMAERSLASHGAFALPWLTPGMNVLDCGCGPGTITLGLAEAIFPGQVIGIDAQPGPIDQARRLSWGLEQINADFRTANVYELPFADQSFDFIFSHALFEHLARPADALAELNRVLSPGGFLALCSSDWDAMQLTPCPGPVREAIATCRHHLSKYSGSPRAGQLLAPWAREAGFILLEQETRFETSDSTTRTGRLLALHLEQAGEWEYARLLRTWANQPNASFTLAWTHLIAQK